MRQFWHRAGEAATSWPTAILTFAVVGYAITLRGLGSLGGSVEASFQSFMLDGSLRAFFLCPVWLVACCIWTVSGRGAEILIRVGSQRSWIAHQMRQGLAESTLIVIPLLLGSLVFTMGGAHDPAAQLPPSWWLEAAASFGLVILALVVARCVISAVFVLTNSRLWLGITAAILWISGAASASGVPLNSPSGMVSWITWSNALLSAEVFGRSWVGAVLLAAVAVVLAGLVSLREIGVQRWLPVDSRVAFWLGVLTIFAGQYTLLDTVARLGAPISWTTAVTILFAGPEPDQVGIPAGSVFLSLVFYFGPAFAMLGQLQNELGRWMSLVVIRSGSHLTWAVQFLTRWLLVVVVTLAGALCSATAAWLLLPDRDRAPELATNLALTIAFRYGFIGLVQLLLYCLLGFLVVWLTGETAAGLGLLVILAVAGVANPLLGGWAPSYLNSLSRLYSANASELRDAITVGVWVLVAIVAIMIIAKIRDRPARERF